MGYPKALSKYDKSGTIGDSAADQSRVMPFALSFASSIPGRAYEKEISRSTTELWINRVNQF